MFELYVVMIILKTNSLYNPLEQMYRAVIFATE